MKTLGTIVGIVTFLIVVVILQTVRKKMALESKQSDMISISPPTQRTNTSSVTSYSEINRDLKDSFYCINNPVAINKKFKRNMKIFYLCRWNKIEEIKNDNQLVAQYAHIINADKMVGISISIDNFESYISDELIEKFRTAEFTKKAVEGINQKYLSFEKILVDGVKGVEIKSYNKGGINEYNHFLINNFYYKNSVITITYFGLDKTENSSKVLMDNYEGLFRSLRDKTKFVE